MPQAVWPGAYRGHLNSSFITAVNGKFRIFDSRAGESHRTIAPLPGIIDDR